MIIVIDKWKILCYSNDNKKTVIITKKKRRFAYVNDQ